MTGSAAAREAEWTCRTLVLLVENRFGVLFQVTGVLSARGYNIESLHVDAPGHESVACIKLTVRCRRGMAEQVVKQLHKIADVVSIDDVTNEKENQCQVSTTNEMQIEVF